MKTKITMSLSKRFGVVEQLIFNLILYGINDSEIISSLLTVFSCDVIANAFMNLTNKQVIRADMERRRVYFSDQMYMIAEFNNQIIDLDFSEELKNQMKDNCLYVDNIDIKKGILFLIEKGTYLMSFAYILDFIISIEGEENDRNME